MSKYSYRIVAGAEDSGSQAYFIEMKHRDQQEWTRLTGNNYTAEWCGSTELALARAKKMIQKFIQDDIRSESNGLLPTETVVETYE